MVAPLPGVPRRSLPAALAFRRRDQPLYGNSRRRPARSPWACRPRPCGRPRRTRTRKRRRRSRAERVSSVPAAELLARRPASRPTRPQHAKRRRERSPRGPRGRRPARAPPPPPRTRQRQPRRARSAARPPPRLVRPPRPVLPRRRVPSLARRAGPAGRSPRPLPHPELWGQVRDPGRSTQRRTTGATGGGARATAIGSWRRHRTLG
mmetsp:Transcript_105009/g.327521  ORF Transcript_105009/g.327521 Transcript_105009/m.327521 type:complete len:207 (-) Transcript_105009:97-717(-)